MAATDQTYRMQRQLDIWFAISSLLMLGSVAWMFAQDYYVPWKPEQRVFRDAKSEVAMRKLLDEVSDTFDVDHAKAVKAVEDERKAMSAGKQEEIDKLRSEISGIQPTKEKADAKFQNIKADLDSRVSFYNIAVDNGKMELAENYKADIRKLTEQLKVAKDEQDAVTLELREKQAVVLAKEKPLNDAIANLTKLNSKLDTLAREAIKEQWGMGDRFRALPIIDAFASPYKIHQFVIDDVPIDYNFKYVTRFDRCATCHQSIANPDFTRERLLSLRAEVSSATTGKLEKIQKVLEQRREALAGLPDEIKKIPNPSYLRVNQLADTWLTDARVVEFTSHPRLDLFVGPKSKHPAEKMGCSACHQGQGSATSFTLASHSPNDAVAQDRWMKEHHWHPEHMWDFPMLPHRFIESSCLKCHHQVTDLYDSDNRNNAPKLLRGYNLIKENGCFGCHEIGGRKGGRTVGPDLRLEPYPPRDDRTPAEVAKLDADPDEAPGYMRKVGPSLFRVSEKTNKEWTARWIKSPRDFRPETKMPHFYGLSNNNKEALKGTGQEEFPDAEVHAITHYLFANSSDYLKKVETAREKNNPAKRSELENKLQALEREPKLDAEQHKKYLELKKELDKMAADDALAKVHAPLKLDADPLKGNPDRGRFLFTIKGCLACHTHHGVETEKTVNGSFFPKIVSEAQFGPDLSQLAGKLGAEGKIKDKKAREKSATNWLVYWIKNPHVHSPRSRMPSIPDIGGQEAADIAAWLLSQDPEPYYGHDWKGLRVAEPSEDILRKLAKVYLVRLLSDKSIADLEAGKKIDAIITNALPEDEQELIKRNGLAKGNKDTLTSYVGRKAISRQGCFACHDIPGFENAKPIGVALNDWGKKDPERLAFENINNYMPHHYLPVDKLTDKDGKPHRIDKGKVPYERFYWDALMKFKNRQGYLNQKILDPRSYDYSRERAWDDRARMPEFRFARSRPRSGENEAEYEARQVVEEAEAREAVATFVLGLVGEPVPMKSVNQPSGERLAEVKGRQVLDKYNCAGCHQIRPGVFDFKLDGATLGDLRASLNRNKMSWNADHFFRNHKNWVGKDPTSPDRVSVHGVNFHPAVEEKMDDEGNVTKRDVVKMTLTQALAVPVGKDDKGKDVYQSIRATKAPLLLSQSSLINPPADVVKDKYRLKAFLNERGPQGGAFAELLEKFLVERDAKAGGSAFYKPSDAGFSENARSAGPPMLIGQGERTQADWLYKFLRDPYQVRPMTAIKYTEDDRPSLRMPKFNMSADEAKTLVAYFSAVERLTNPGTDLPPVDEIFAEVGVNSNDLLQKSRSYVAMLKADKDKGESKYEARKKAFTPLWKSIEEAQKKDAKGKTESMESLEKAWERHAYIVDGYTQLVVSDKKVCSACHSISGQPTGDVRGPALDKLHDRLRPGWVERWLSKPERMIYYTPMPENLPANGYNFDMARLFAPDGTLDNPRTAQLQVRAARDVILLYPQAAALPTNQRWLQLYLMGDKKK